MVILLFAAVAIAEPAPRGAAVIAQEEDGVRLYVSDFGSGSLEPVGDGRDVPHDPVWSPDGRRLAYRVGEKLFVHAAGKDELVDEHVEIETAQPCAFSPDGTRLAVVEHGRVVVAGEVAAAREGQQVADLLWDPSGLWILFWSAKAGAELVRAGSPDARHFPDGSRLLGVRPDGEVLVLRSSGGRESIGAVAVEEGRAAVAYSPFADAVLLAAMGEDSDPPRLFIHGLAKPATRAWSVGAVSSLRLSRRGAWALLVTARGDVRLASFGSAKSRVVLRATRKRSYSLAVPRPQ